VGQTRELFGEGLGEGEGCLLVVDTCGLETGLCAPRQLVQTVSNAPARMTTRPNAKTEVRGQTPRVGEFNGMEDAF